MFIISKWLNLVCRLKTQRLQKGGKQEKSTKPLLLKEVPRQRQHRRCNPKPRPQTEARTTGAQLRVPIRPHVAPTGGSTGL